MPKLHQREIPPEIKSRFRKETNDLRAHILAPPLTGNYSWVGEAFDYLLRFYVKRLNPKARISWWRPEQFIRMNRQLGEYAKRYPNHSFVESYLRSKQLLSAAKRSYRSYMFSGEMTEQLLRSVLHLAKLDIVFLTASNHEVFQLDIEDLKNLISLVEPSKFKSKGLTVLAPQPRDRLVGPDLLIGRTMIDIKTTMKLHLKKEYYNQLVSNYHSLTEIGIKGVKARPRIDKCGLYFSRYGFMFLIEVKDLFGSLAQP